MFEEGSFIPQAKLQNGKSYSIITDHLGTPTDAYDEKGKKVWNRELDIYGKTRKFTGESNFVPFTYQGQYYDEEVELAYNRFRWYSPDSGTYISQDPIRLASGEDNLYAYVSDVNSWIDPLGLSACSGGKKTNNLYKGIQEASQILKERGLPRKVRKEILESFDKETILVRKATKSEFGIRFFGGKAEAKGRYVFETFPANRNSLAIKSEWGNSMRHIKQFQIKENTLLFEGRAAAQGNLTGGQIQKFIVDNPFTNLL